MASFDWVLDVERKVRTVVMLVLHGEEHVLLTRDNDVGRTMGANIDIADTLRIMA